MTYDQYLADIAPHEYEAFRRLTGNGLPHTFEEWGDMRNKYRAHLASKGNTAIVIEIHPDEFAEFCRNRGMPRDAHSLDQWAYEKAQRKSNRQG